MEQDQINEQEKNEKKQLKTMLKTISDKFKDEFRLNVAETNQERKARKQRKRT